MLLQHFLLQPGGFRSTIHQKLHSESQSWARAFWAPGQPECEVAGAWAGGPCGEAEGHRQQGQQYCHREVRPQDICIL